ncbi:MAG TPA: VOC family protein [Actinomycetota bacterium]|nr:VOC family protein [Actinomycetota bacterium]
MGLALDALTFDCAEPLRVATFWCAALGFELDHDPDDPEDDVALARDPSGRSMGLDFQSVPEPKAVKNRVHLDVRPTGSMAEEVARLEALGATVRGYIEEGGSFWTQMRDVEGNEFCVLRGPADGWSPDEL